MSGDDRRPLIEITDILGLSGPLTRLVEAISRGVGSWLEPWVRKRDARASIEITKQWREALPELRSGSLSSPEIGLEGRAALRWQEDLRRHQRTRESIAIAAVEQARDPELTAEEVDGDGTGLDEGWIDRFWRLAQDVFNEDLQRLWGRILLRESLRAGAIGPRTLEVVSLLRREDAHELERLARFTCTALDWRGREQAILVTSIPRSHPLGNVAAVDHAALQVCCARIAKTLGSWRDDYFGPLGIFVESGWIKSLRVSPYHESLPIRLGSHRYELRGFRPPNSLEPDGSGAAVALLSGIFWTAIGRELLNLVRAAPHSEFVAALREGFAQHGLQLVGPIDARR